MRHAHDLTLNDLDFGADLGDALSQALGEVLGRGAPGSSAGARPASGTYRAQRPSTQAWESDDLVLVIDGLRPVAIGGRHVDPGTYRVRVDEARERIVLENDERTYALTAFFRRSKAQRGPGVSLAEASPDGRHLLAVRVSASVEWVA